MVKRYSHLMVAVTGAGDVLVAAASWIIAYLARDLMGRAGLTRHPLPPFDSFIAPMLFCLVLTPLVFTRMDLYLPKRTKSLLRELAEVARAVTIVWLLTWVFANMTRRVMISRLMMGALGITWNVLALTSRLVGRNVLRCFRRRGWNQRYAAIVGTGRLAQKLFHALKKSAWTGIRVLYFVGDRKAGGTLLDLDVLGPFDDVARIVAVRPVDIVFVALRCREQGEARRIVDRLMRTGADVRVVPDLLTSSLLKREVTQLDDLAIVSVTHSPQHGWHSLAKRAFDLLACLVALAVLAVPMLIIAAVIRLLDKGPVFYRQRRASLSGREFTIVKFRTMTPDAEAHTGPVWGAAKQDERVTRIGRLLRRTGLDEIPQLFNVLVGDMSLVGPRPERPEFIRRFREQVPGYMLRHQVKAGLTGLAQVHGLRGRTSLRKRLQYDLYYISNWSFGLDLWILLMTPLRAYHRDT